MFSDDASRLAYVEFPFGKIEIERNVIVQILGFTTVYHITVDCLYVLPYLFVRHQQDCLVVCVLKGKVLHLHVEPFGALPVLFGFFAFRHHVDNVLPKIFRLISFRRFYRLFFEHKPTDRFHKLSARCVVVQHFHDVFVNLIKRKLRQSEYPLVLFSVLRFVFLPVKAGKLVCNS